MPNIKDQLNDCLKFIRFPTMIAEHFLCCLEKYPDLLAREEYFDILFYITAKRPLTVAKQFIIIPRTQRNIIQFRQTKHVSQLRFCRIPLKLDNYKSQIYLVNVIISASRNRLIDRTCRILIKKQINIIHSMYNEVHDLVLDGTKIFQNLTIFNYKICLKWPLDLRDLKNFDGTFYLIIELHSLASFHYTLVQTNRSAGLKLQYNDAASTIISEIQFKELLSDKKNAVLGLGKMLR